MADDATVVSLAGELDIASAPGLERQLEAAQSSEPVKLVIDLTALEFIDSTGLRVLLTARRRASDARQALVLRNPRGQVRRIFEVSGVLEQFSFNGD